MGLDNNTPTVTWLSISRTTITYNGNIYSVDDIKTNKEYIYWETTNPNKFRVTNDDLGVSGTRFLVFKNNRGEGVKVPNNGVIVSFDGNNSKIAEDEIFGLTEKVGTHDDKFINVIKDIDGIEQNVGTWNVAENGTITENISTIKQTAEDIDFSVKETTKEFNEEKTSNRLRDNINKSLIDFNKEIGTLSSKFYSFSKNSVIDSEETTYINTQLTFIDSKISEVNLRIDEVIALANTQGQTTQKDAITTEKNKLNVTYTSLKNYISSAISDGVTTPTDITGVVNLLSKCNTDVTTLKNTVDDFIFLGTGGKIIEELARISIKSDEIVLSVSHSEEIAKSTLGIEKNILQGQVTDYKNANYKLKDKVSEVSTDGIVSESEKTVLTTEIAKVDTERANITTKYNELYNNARISTDVKNALKTEYDLFNNKCIETNTKINNVVSDGFINSAEKNETDTLLNESVIKVLTLQAKMCQAIDDIDKNTVSWNLAQEKLALQQEISDVDEKIGDLNTYVDGTFKDNALDTAERTAIKQNLSTLAREKIDIDTQYTQWYGSVELDGTLKTSYQTAYNNYVSKYNSLVSIINGILAKQTLVDNTDRTSVTNAETLLNTNLSTYAQKTKEVIDYVMNKRDTNLKTDLQGNIDDVSGNVTSLNTYIDGTFKDNQLDANERKIIKQNLDNISLQKADVDSMYTIIYGNANLIGTPKTELQTAYNDFISKNNALNTVVTTILNKQTLIDNADRTNHDTAMTNLKTSIGTLTTKFTNAQNNIATNVSIDLIDDISIGTRNLYNKIIVLSTLSGGATATKDFADGYDSACKSIRFLGSATTSSIRFNDITKSNGTYSISFWIKSNTASTYNSITFDVGDNATSSSFSATPTWTYVKLENLTQSNWSSATYDFIDLNLPVNADILISHVMIVEGNKSTTWFPSSLDIDSQIKVANDLAESNSTLLQDIASDSKLTPNEKVQVKKEIDYITSEKANIIAEAGIYLISTTAYTTAYNTLNDYLTPLLADLTTTSTIVGTDVRTKFSSYYTERSALLKNVASISNNYVSSRGQNLVTNGTGLMKNNLNFTSFIFDGSDSYYSQGSFKDATYYQTRLTDELIPIQIDKTYRLSVSAKCNPYVGAKYYVGIVAYDVDGNTITSSNHMYYANTLTTLAQDLKAGDTKIYLTSATNWLNNNAQTYQRGFIFWNYQNSLGYQYPELTYSRNIFSDKFDIGAIDYATNSITLKTAWAGSTITAGTKLSQTNSGSSYKYITASNVAIPNTWTQYTGTISGIDLTGTNINNKFPPGTANVKLLFLNNRDIAGSTVWYSNLSFGLDLASQDDVTVIDNMLDDITSDTKLTPSEKIQLKKEWDIIVSEKPTIELEADVYSVVKTTFNTSYTTLSGLTTPLLSDLTTTSTVDGVALRSAFSTYYLEKAKLLKEVSLASRTYTDNGISAIKIGGRNLALGTYFNSIPSGWTTMNTASNLVTTTGRLSTNGALQVTVGGTAGGFRTADIVCLPNTQYTISYWIKSSAAGSLSDLMKFKDVSNVETNPVADIIYSVSANTWTYHTFTITTPSTSVKLACTPRSNTIASCTLSITEFQIEIGNKVGDWSPAPEDAKLLIDDMSNDNKITPLEKQNLKIEYDRILKDKVQLDAQAVTCGLTTEKTTYDDSYTALITNYIDANGILTNLSTTSDINGETMRTLFSTYSDAKAKLETAITNFVKGYTDTQIGNIVIGTSNLLLNTAFINDTTNWSLSTNVTRDTTVLLGGVNAIKSIQSGFVADQWRGFYSPKTRTLESMGLKVGDYVSGSVWAKSDLIGEGMGFEITCLKADGVTKAYTYSGTGYPTSTGIWTLIECENKLIPSDAVFIYITTWVRRNGAWYFAKPKLEKGTKCTDWNVAREDLRSEISDVSGSVGTLSDTMNGAFKDGVLSDAEKKAINEHLKTIANEKEDVDKQYTSLYGNVDLVGTAKTNLQTAYNDFVAKYNALDTAIDTIVAKVGLVDTTDRTTLNTAFTNYKTSTGTYSTRVEEAVSSISLKTVTDAKTLLQGNIDDANQSVTDLSGTMNGAFKDGVLSDAEKKAIKQNLQTVGNEKAEVDKQHSTVYANTNLLDPAKANLLTAYTNYNTTYDALGVIINNILNKVGLIDSTDQTNLTTAFTNYRTNSGIYSQRLNEALDSIAGKKSADAEQNSKTYTDGKVTILNNSISLKSSKIELSEALRQGEITTNPVFYNWVDGQTHPTGYSSYGTVALTKETTLVRNGGYGARFNVTTLGTLAGMYMGSTAYIPNVTNSKYLYLEVDFMLVSGTLPGAGILVDWQGMSSYRTPVELADYVTSPTIGKWETVRTIVKRPSDTVTGWSGMSGYVMANWTAFSGGNNAVKDIVFDRVSIREATAEEIATVDLDARLDSAEVKITPEAITQTVKSQRSASIYKVRYIRDYINGSTVNIGNHWCEIKVINNKGLNLASGLNTTDGDITSSATIGLSTNANPGTLTDGVVSDNNYLTTTVSGLQYIQLDLGGVYQNIENIIVWHYYEDGRTYHNNKTQVSEDGINWYTVFDSAVEGEYAESKNGHSIKVNQSASTRTGIATFDDKGFRVENSDSDTYTLMDSGSFSVNSNTGNTIAEFGSTSIIPNLNAGTIIADTIYSPNIVNIQTSLSYYVNMSTGNDSNNGSSGSPLKTIQCAVDNLYKYLAEDSVINIYISGISSANQDVRVRGFNGAGVIVFRFTNGSKLYTSLFDIRECTCKIAIWGDDVWSTSTGQIINGDTGSCIYVRGCTYVHIWHMCLCGTGKGNGYAVNSVNGSTVYVDSCEVDRFSSPIRAEYKGRISLFNTSGSDLDYICTGSNFGEIYLQEGYGVVPNATYESNSTGATYYMVFGGDAQSSGSPSTRTNGTIYAPATAPPTPPATTTNTRTWTFNKIWSDETLNGWSDKAELIQGYASTWATGRYTGYMQMTDGMAGIRDTISGGTNLSGKVYVQRRTTSGNSVDSKLCLYASDGTAITTTTLIDQGQGVWVNIDSAMVTKIMNGTVTYFYLKADTNSTSTYFKCESNAQIQITYTK